MPATKTCQTCEGTGWVLFREEETEKVSACPDCRSQSRSSQRLQSAAIPPRYGEQGFETFSTPNSYPLLRKALLRSIEFVDAFPELERGLLFVGPCGVGKTHLSVAILNAVLSEHDSSARFVDEAELLRSLQHSYGRDSQSSEEELLRPLRRAELLVWDDLGTGRPTDWVRETIHTIINYRYTNQRLTIFSSNWKLPEKQGAETLSREPTLSDRIGERLYSRVLEMCEIVEMKGPDFRKEVHKAGKDFQRTHKG